MSKSLLIIAGGLLVAGIIGAVVLHSVAKSKESEQETADFVLETVNAISQDWNPQELVHRAEPGLIKAMASQGQSVYDLFTMYRKLGAVESPPVCHLKDTSQFAGTADNYITVTYVCEAEYEKAPATILITVRRGSEASEWRVYYINISSPGLASD